jgi:hypothetical protein
MHQTDERVPVEDIRRLSEIYLDILRRFFARRERRQTAIKPRRFPPARE